MAYEPVLQLGTPPQALPDAEALNDSRRYYLAAFRLRGLRTPAATDCSTNLRLHLAEGGNQGAFGGGMHGAHSQTDLGNRHWELDLPQGFLETIAESRDHRGSAA
jgi:hypothetical protein